MKKSITLTFAVLGLLAFGAACGTTSTEKKSGSISGVEVFRFKENEATDEKLLEGVKVTLADGTETKPELKKGEADYTKAGAYEITYAYGVSEIDTVLYIYGTPQIYYGEELLADTVTVDYRSANASYGFSKGVKVVDTFGVALETELTADSEIYDGGVGEYTVTYRAVDCVGNELQKTVTYTVTAENAPVASDTTLVLGKDGGKLAVDWKGATEAYIYLDGVLIDADAYQMQNDGIVFDEAYLIALGLKEHAFKIKTVDGVTDIALTVADEGYPVFAMNSLQGLYTIGLTKALEPMKLMDAHEEYQYSYALKDKDGNEYAVTDEFGHLTFVDSTNEFIPVGNYILTVTGTADDGILTSERTYSFSVTSPTLSGGESSTINLVSLDETEYGVTEAYHFVKEAKDAWGGRLQSSIPAGVFRSITFDFFVNDCSEKIEEEGLVNTTFALCVNGIFTPTAPNIKFFDKTTGEEVAQENLKIGQWYAVEGDLALQTKDGSFYFYVEPYDNSMAVGIDAYIANFKFNLIGNTLTPALWAKHDAGAVVKGTVNEDGEYVLSYTGTAEWGGRVGFSLPMLEKYQLYYNNMTEDTKYELVFDMRFVSEPANMQFWLHTEKGYGATPTMASMLTGGTAKAYDSLGLLATELKKGEWYQIRIDMEKLGWVADNSGNIGVQFGAVATIEFKNAEISEKKILDDTELLFAKLSVQAHLTFGAEDGVAVASYENGSASEWDGRIIFSDAMAQKFIALQALCDSKKAYLLCFDFQFVGDPANLQFWYSDGAMKAFTFDSYASTGIIVAKDSQGKVVASVSEMTKGEWYTVSFKLASMPTLQDYCLQLGCLSAFKYKNVRFEETSTSIALFQAVSTGAISVTAQEGEFAQKITKTGTQDHWSSRAGMTKKAYDKYMSALAETGYLMQFKLQYVSGAGNDWQFWNAGSTPTPTLSGLLAGGTVTIVDEEGNAVTAVADMQNGVTYTFTVDVDKMGTCSETATEYGWQFGINEKAFEMLVSAVTFVKKA